MFDISMKGFVRRYSPYNQFSCQEEDKSAETNWVTCLIAPRLELGSRDEFIRKHVHQSLHSELHGLSDIELYSLGHHTFGDQAQLLQSFQGSESFGTRCLAMPRARFVQTDKVHQDLKQELSCISDQELLSLTENFTGDAQVTELMHRQQRDGSPKALALARVQLSRNAYIDKYIHNDVRDKLSPLSDGAVLVLGKAERSQQPNLLDEVSKVGRVAISLSSLFLTVFLRFVSTYSCHGSHIPKGVVTITMIDTLNVLILLVPSDLSFSSRINQM